MGRVFTLPKKSQASLEAPKPIKGSPSSLYYVITKAASGLFQIINKSALDGAPAVVQYSAAKRADCLDWLVENDDSSPYKEAA